MKSSLKIHGASENNLKHISLEVPHDQLTVVTGLSGSGKSSLAFGTIYAEGQRRYIETFSSYTRQFFDKIKKPDVDLIQYVKPAIAIQQKNKIRSSRSTVGSVSGINDYLKILWANLSESVCPSCSIPLKADTPSIVADICLKKLKEVQTSRYAICAPIRFDFSQSKATVAKKQKIEIERLRILGFSRFLNPDSGEIVELDTPKTLVLTQSEELLVLIERFSNKSSSRKQIIEAVEKSYQVANKRVCLVNLSKNQASKVNFLTVVNCDSAPNLRRDKLELTFFRNEIGCDYSDLQIKPARPSLFSFNHPYGACESCRGFGSILTIDLKKCIPNPRLSIEEGAIAPWAVDSRRWEMNQLLKFCKHEKIKIDIAWNELSQEQQALILEGNSDFKGLFSWFKRLERKAYKTHVRVFLARYRSEELCGTCNGARLNSSALAYKIDQKSIADIWDAPISELLKLTEKLSSKIDPESYQLIEVYKTLLARLQFLEHVGLPYLTLGRNSNTLSGGETQRVNLAAAIGSNLVSTQFVLDEPTVGLHSRDTDRLLTAIRQLQGRGNSIVMVEHDLDCIAEADHIIELGPKAGSEGGEVVYAGDASLWNGISLAPYLTSLSRLTKSKTKANEYFGVKGAKFRNLKNIDLKIPIGSFSCLTGVSGSGKTTLLQEVFLGSLELSKRGEDFSHLCEELVGIDKFEQVLLVDQSPIAKSPRGNIATYSGIWNEVRLMLAATDAAISRALDKSAFSFNVDAGRCTTCRGAGFIKEDMQFLSDVYIPCEVCLGTRFQEHVLEVEYQGKNVAELLNFTVSDVIKFFGENKKIFELATMLESLGLGYLRLGHSLSELSGGEAQRLKLVPFLAKNSEQNMLFLFDEPTTGLHLHDISKLLEVFEAIRSNGHTVLCVEHNLALIYAADWIVDLGPDGGSGGGEICACGDPKKLVSQKKKSSETISFLENFKNDLAQKAEVFLARQKKITSKLAKPIKQLEIRHAKENNLKDINVSIPLNQIVAFTGVSGSGKSTIAKDIIYSEGQRTYLDCLSPYARQYIRELKHPDIESISGILPTICVHQHTFQPSELSTVGTMSEIYNYLRLLFAKVGTQYCPDHPDMPIAAFTAKEIASELQAKYKTKIKILAPVVRGRKGYHKSIFEKALAAEISEVRVDGFFGKPSSYLEGLERNKTHDIDYVVAHCTPNNVDFEILESVITQAITLGSGTIIVSEKDRQQVFSTERNCSICKRGFLKPDPEDLSFRSRRGVCDDCGGFGDYEGGEKCHSCYGARLGPVGRSIKIDQLNIWEASKLTLINLFDFLSKLKISEREKALSEQLISEMLARTKLLIDFGLGYLCLNRDCLSVSTGELQRLRLAAALGSPLSGVMYILDEPSVGLHPNDNAKLLDKLAYVKEQGNSVIVIEHDPDTILASDYILDVGPSGGQHGGEIIFSGTIQEFSNSQTSITAQALFSEPPLIENSDSNSVSEQLVVESGSCNNILNLSVTLPLNSLISVVGVSGAGKSSFVHGIIEETILNGEYKQNRWKCKGNVVSSTIPIKRVVSVDQKPIGKTSRSTPGSYFGVWDEIRKVFAKTIDAQARGWKAGYFSFNTGQGRCSECQGVGEIKLEMSFLPSAKIPCQRCQGGRFSEEACSVRYNGLNISEALSMTIEEAKDFFVNHKKIYQPLSIACDLGIGYITLGQNSATLSGGEAQRLKLVSELTSNSVGHTLYILDEPTTGLHIKDVYRLINVLHALVQKGNSVLVVEHDQQCIQASDFVLEFGPGADLEGGDVIFSGKPGQLYSSKTPWGEIFKGNSLSKKQA
ncbi:MAG: excinuclease ABC subunit UvrA [Deltaproteobacteria bacterium]|nr:excinuclease ABC subunit UvrA [Deltaproteobacteria bacterium]